VHTISLWPDCLLTSFVAVSGQTLFYSILMLGIGPASWYTGLTTWPFIIDSSILNLWLIWSAYKFYQDNTNTSARRTFKLTLYYLPIFIILMLIHLSYWGDDEDEEKPALDDSNPDELALSKSADKP
jgi:heme O synthase-like polyprenyltransferase